MDRTSYQNYIYAKLDNRERQVIAHQLYQANFRQNFQKVLDEYGLAARLQAAGSGQETEKGLSLQRVNILDAGCGRKL